jgi:hypothetical protein
VTVLARKSTDLVVGHWVNDRTFNPQGWDYLNLNDVRWYACMRFEERLAYLDWIIAIRQAALDAHNAVSTDGDKRLFDYAANQLAVRLRRVQERRRIELSDREPLPDWYQDYRRYLYSGRWDRIRRRKLTSVHHYCEHPDCKRSATACHHKHYNSLGFEENNDLEALCVRHHVARHSNGQGPRRADVAQADADLLEEWVPALSAGPDDDIAPRWRQ